MDEESLAGTFVGTMNYMSPERMEGEKYSFEGDIWSLGIVLIELVIGFYPFQETKGFLEMLEQIKYEPSPTLPRNSGYSEELTDFIDICLQKEGHMRASTLTLLAHPFILNTKQSSADLPRYFNTLR